MAFLFLAIVLFSSCLVRAANWYTVEWDAPQFTAMSGDFVVPALPPSGGTPYVWPGLQSGKGVLQAVCDGRKGAWWIGDGFYGTPSLPWGNGFSVSPGQTVHFTFTLGSNNNWTATLSGPGSATTTLNIPNNTMNRAILAVELTNVPFTFGPIIYRNLKITATTAASNWCYKTVSLGYSSGQYTVSGASASGNTCSVSQVTMPSRS
ncbi:hypothetical protein CPB86DRAFT_419845 [Serendipita vermifera]|nr:hypothetical protein CPB86DRAFT_419845 [Serendipita vermifera]